MNYAVLCDFDGTIVNIDTAVLVLEKFANPGWRAIDEQYERGEITLEQCLQRQFSTVKASKLDILDVVDKSAKVRAGFRELVENCQIGKVPFVIVSAGMDFVIQHVLGQLDLQDAVELYTPKTRMTSRGITFTFPKILDTKSFSFKDDLVKHYREQGKRVIYVGDGFSDFHAAKIADETFAINRSELAGLLQKDGSPYREISDFRDVGRTLGFV